MKKKYIIILPIAIICIISIINLFKIVSYKLRVYRIENMLLSYFNLNYVNGLTVGCKELIEFYKTDPPTEYNVSPLVDFYISQLNELKNDKRGNKDIWENKRLYINDNDYYIQNAFNYTGYVNENNIDIDFVTNELEKIFIHRDTEWFLNVESNNEYELPYQYYLIYNKRKYKKLDKVKRVIKVKFTEKIDFKDKQYKKKSYNIDVFYLDKNNIKQIDKRYASYNFETDEWSAGLNELWYNNDGDARITLHHHTYDKEKEEEEKRMNDIQTEFQEMMQEYEANLSDEERYFNPAFGD